MLLETREGFALSTVVPGDDDGVEDAGGFSYPPGIELGGVIAEGLALSTVVPGE